MKMDLESRIIGGDALAILPVLGMLELKFDMVLCDLPYGTTRCRWDTVIPFTEMWSALEGVTRDDTPVLLFAQTPFDKVLGASNLADLRYEWVWEKTEATGHLNSKRAPLKAHENILVFYRKAPFYSPQKTTGHVRKQSDRCNARSGSEIYGEQKGRSSYNSTERYPRSVLTFPKDKQRSALHPTQKPIALLSYLIETYTRPGDLILDFAIGSGSTAVAAQQSGRRCIGIELDPEYVQIAKSRLASTHDREF